MLFIWRVNAWRFAGYLQNYKVGSNEFNIQLRIMKKKRDVMLLKFYANAASKSWLAEKSWEARCLQIQSMFSPELGIQLAGCGDRISNDRQLIQVTLTFVFQHLQQTCAEFQRVAQLLKFPPGTRMTAITYDENGDDQFTDLAEW